jgi:hypothetical protein
VVVVMVMMMMITIIALNTATALLESRKLGDLVPGDCPVLRVKQML